MKKTKKNKKGEQSIKKGKLWRIKKKNDKE